MAADRQLQRPEPKLTLRRQSSAGGGGWSNSVKNHRHDKVLAPRRGVIEVCPLEFGVPPNMDLDETSLVLLRCVVPLLCTYIMPNDVRWQGVGGE